MTTMKTDPRPLCLFGDIVLDDGSVRRAQYVQMAGGRIRSIDSSKPDGKVDYRLKDDELLFPAFLDLHTHSTYNTLPLWRSPYWAWDNRFQWRNNSSYKSAVGGAVKSITAASGEGSGVYDAFNAFSELMALAGGTTVLQENASLDQGTFPRQAQYLIRNTGSSESLGLPDWDAINSVLEFYKPNPWYLPSNPYQDTSSWKVEAATKSWSAGTTYVSDFALTVSGTRTVGTIVHLAEGRSGFLQTLMGADAYSRAEFTTFMNFVTSNYRGDDIRRVQEARLALIHGCGMDVSSAKTAAATIKFLQAYGIGLIWSPVSNLLLYQDTTNVLPLLDAGVPVALGTDWTPSGSKTVWEEARFAADFLEARGWKGDIDLTCFRGVTSVAADLLGLPLGRLRTDNLADVMIVRRPRGVRRDDALGTFRRAGDADIRAVFVGGAPLYGDAKLLRALGAKAYPLPGEDVGRKHGESPVVRSKAFAFPSHCGVTYDDLERVIEATDRVLKGTRCRILAADDAPYQARMRELRTWVRNFGPGTRNARPSPSPPTGLAPGELEWMYNPSLDPKNRVPAEVNTLLARMAPCRDRDCPVPQSHPFYHAEVLEQAGDSYGFRIPCMPVLPVLTNQKQLFVMGDYPTAKFAARSTNALPIFMNQEEITDANRALGSFLDPAMSQQHPKPQVLQTYVEELNDLVRGAAARPDVAAGKSYTPSRKNEFFVPIGDVFAPMQDADYFDGYKVRNVASGVFLQDNYFTPVGIDVTSQVWLTNLIKCYLFHQNNVDAYQELGWTDVPVRQSYTELLPAGQVCSQWITQEVQICDPTLVLTVGKPPCVLPHNVPIKDTWLQSQVYNALLGVWLPANDTRIETGAARTLHLASKYPPPFPIAGSRRSPSRTPRPVSIVRLSPWKRYNMFHMMHPQAVMMSQTSIVTVLQQAIQLKLGPKAKRLTYDQLDDAIRSFLAKHKLAELIDALPYGQRDVFHSNATLLETQAVTLAELADTLVKLGLTPRNKWTGAKVLAAQAKALVRNFHLADSAAAELKRLQKMRDAKRAAVAAYRRAGTRR